MENSRYPIKNSDFTFLKHIERPHTLNYECMQDRQAVAITLTKAIFKAAAVMGINLDANKASFTIQEVIGQIGKIYPMAYIDDIVQSIEMASYGDIKLEGQLTTISAHNVYSWYREFRLNHFDKSSRSMFATYLPMEAETKITEEEKKREMLESFKSFLNNPTDIGFSIYYDIFVKIEAIPKNLYESRTEMFLMEAQNLSSAVPPEMLMNGDWRRQAYAYANYVNGLREDEQFDYNKWKDNILHKRAIERCKRFLVTETMKRVDNEELIQLYKKSSESE